MTQANSTNQTIPVQTQNVTVPEQKPKWKQFTFWLPILTPLLNFAMIMVAVKYPTISDALRRSGLQDSIWILVGGASFTSSAYIVSEKHRDGIITSALVQAKSTAENTSAVIASNALQTASNASASDSAPNSTIPISIVDDPNEQVHYRDAENAG